MRYYLLDSSHAAMFAIAEALKSHFQCSPQLCSLDEIEEIVFSSGAETTSPLLITIEEWEQVAGYERVVHTLTERGADLMVFGILTGEAARQVEHFDHPLFDDFVLVTQPETVREDALVRARLSAFVRRVEARLGARAIELFVDASEHAVWIWDLISDKLIWPGQGADTLDFCDGRAPARLSEFMALAHPEDRASFNDSLSAHLRAQRIFRDVSVRLRTERGWREFAASGRVMRDDRNQPMTMVGAMRDVTHERDAARALRESEARYAALFRSMHEAAILYDPGSHLILDVNPPAEALWGRTRVQLVGSPSRLLHPPTMEDRERRVLQDAVASLERARLGERSEPVPVPIQHADGSVQRALMRLTRLDLDGRTVHLALFEKDTAPDRGDTIPHTYLKDTNTYCSPGKLATIARLVAHGKLVPYITHEINNPLSFVLGNLLLVEQELDESAVDLGVLDAIHDAVEGATRISDLLRDLTHSCVHDIDRHELGAVEVTDVVSFALRALSHKLRHCAPIEVYYAPGLPRVRATRSGLSQIVLHLIANAAQALPEDRDVDLNVIKLHVELEGDRATFLVSDTGRGMTPEQIEQAYAPFYTSCASSLGLGMGLVRDLVESYGGQLQIESAIGEGTVAKFSLPAYVIDEPYDLALFETTEVTSAEDRRLRVLIVDDELHICRALTRVLGDHYDAQYDTNRCAS